MRRTATAQRLPKRATALCTHQQLHAGFAGGGPALGYLDAVVRFRNVGAPCHVSGWPQLVTVSATGRQQQTIRTVASPALTRAEVTGHPAVQLQRGQSAYLIIDGEDHNRQGRSCPSYSRFVLRIRGIPGTFNLPAKSPGFLHRFPDCGGVGHTVLVPANDIIPKQRQPR